MSFTLTGGSILTKATKLTTTSATALYTAQKRTVILSIVATEITGNTPALTLELYDATTSYYLRNALAMTAKQTLIFNEPLTINAGWSIRATAGAANQIDCLITFMSPDATALGTWNGPQG
jgi:hypothetical protein